MGDTGEGMREPRLMDKPKVLIMINHEAPANGGRRRRLIGPKSGTG